MCMGRGPMIRTRKVRHMKNNTEHEGQKRSNRVENHGFAFEDGPTLHSHCVSLAVDTALYHRLWLKHMLATAKPATWAKTTFNLLG
eukprot:4782684-Amphidinium_carterae.1